MSEKSEKKFPRLYKKTSTGKIQEWEIKVRGNHIITTHGYQGGAKQTGEDVVHEGKNLGKKNETTPEQQALAEAEARWELKKRKNGYAETLAAAQAGETEHEGGIFPMLAKSFSKDGKHVKFPCAVQPKLDGIRCIAVVDGGEVSLWTRTRKPIDGLPHVRAALAEAFPVGQHVLDGELYNHALKEEFERIVSAVRGGKQDVDLVEYHLYDYPSVRGDFAGRSAALLSAFARDLSAEDRAAVLHAASAGAFSTSGLTVGTLLGKTVAFDARRGPLVFVETREAEDEAAMMALFQAFRDLGYEGAMARNVDGRYAEGKRSADLQKLKEFADAEFEVVGIEEGRGKLAGHVGAFVCKTASGEEFNAKLMGELSRLKKLFDGPESAWKGKLLTVRYQGMTNGDVPRFPVGVRFLDELKGGRL